MQLATSADRAVSQWRDLALERDGMAKSMTRICALLFLIALTVSAAAVHSHSRYSGICRSIDGEEAQLRNLSDRELDFARRLHRKHCD